MPLLGYWTIDASDGVNISNDDVGLPRKLAAIGLSPENESVRVGLDVGLGVICFCGLFVGSPVGLGLSTATIVGSVWII